MPRLLTFLPCEKVLFGGQDSTVSLIVVLAEIHIVMINEEAIRNIPADGIIAYNWAVFTQWENLGDEANIDFEQQVSLYSASGKLAFSNIARFSFAENVVIHRLAGALQAVPLLPAGTHQLIAQWRRVGEDSWSDAGRYPMRFVYEVTKLPIAPIRQLKPVV